MQNLITQHVDDLEDLHLLCRQGKIYEVEEWIRQGRPLQLAPEIKQHGRYKSALTIAIETGQNSLCLLLLRNGYNPNNESTSPFDWAVRKRRKDLVDLLFEYAADPHKMSLWILFDSYDKELYDVFYTAGVDLTRNHDMADHLGEHAGNKPLFGFIKKHSEQHPKIQRELDIALGEHTRRGNEKGVLLCLWAGANPYAPIIDLYYDRDEKDLGDELGNAIDYAVLWDNVFALKKFNPDPNRVDFDLLYQVAKSREVVEFLAKTQPPQSMAAVITGQAGTLSVYQSSDALEAILSCGTKWAQADKDTLKEMRRSLLSMESNYDLAYIIKKLQQPDICAPEIFDELTRTPAIQKRLIEQGLIKPKAKPPTKKELLRREVEQYSRRFDREKLYAQVWEKPVMHVAKSYGVSGVYLGKACRALRVPRPPRGYWARLRNGQKPRKPKLPVLRY